MPEALAIVAVFVTAVVIYIMMWFQSRDPALYDARAERRRLEHHLVWLEERGARARRESWGEEMIAGIEADRTATTDELARLKAGRGEASAS